MRNKELEIREELALHTEEINRLAAMLNTENGLRGPRLDLLIDLLSKAHEKSIELRLLKSLPSPEAPPASPPEPEAPAYQPTAMKLEPEPAQQEPVIEPVTPENTVVSPPTLEPEIIPEPVAEAPEEPISPEPESMQVVREEPEPAVAETTAEETEEPVEETEEAAAAEDGFHFEPEPAPHPTPEISIEKEEEPAVQTPISLSEIERDVRNMGVPDDDSSLNDKLSQKQSDASLSDRIQRQAIHNLRSAIGLNERFLFANELFNGNVESFNRAIDELNEMTNQAEAKRFLSHQQAKFNWDTESETVRLLVDLVERRFLHT